MMIILSHLVSLIGDDDDGALKDDAPAKSDVARDS